jgi:ABC-type transport system substrate-binding protein
MTNRMIDRSLSRRGLLKSASVAGLGGLVGTHSGLQGGSVSAAMARQADANGGTLTIALDTFTTEDWLVHTGGSNISWGPAAALYEYLLYYDPDDMFRLTPGLAEAWSHEGLRDWTFTIRSGVPWQGGSGEVTVEDVAYSLELLARDDAASPDTPYWRARLDNMEIVDASTLRFSFDTIEADLAYQLSAWRVSMIQSQDYLESVGESEARSNPIGSGPYRYDRISPGSEAIVRAIDAPHWRVGPHWDELVFLNLPESSTRLAMLDTERADFVQVNPEQLAEAINAGYTIHPGDARTQFSIILGGLFREDHPQFTGEEPWQDIRVREALNIAIDRPAINTVFFGDTGTYEWTPANMLAPFSTMTGLESPYDPERAQSLIDEAGASGAPIRIASYPYPGITQAPQVLEAVASYWEAAGLRPELVPMDRLVMRDLWVADETNDLAFPWANPEAPTFQARFEKFFWSEDIGFQIYSDAHLDEEYARLIEMSDEQERMALVTNAQHYAREQWGAVHLLNVPMRLFAGRGKVGSWRPAYGGEYAFWEYLTPSE